MRCQLIEILIVVALVSGANCWFETCDTSYNLQSSVQLQSPYFPDRYRPQSSCRYKFTAPLDYTIALTCDLNLDKFSAACSTEFFYISREGDSTLRGSEYHCGKGRITTTSLFNTLVLAYTSSSASTAGSFNCTLSLVAPDPNTCDCGWSVNTKITGGQEAGLNEFPFIALLRYKPTNNTICGGTIISHRYVLTAAHCTRLYPNARDIEIVVGEHDLRTTAESYYYAKYNVLSIREHENYNPSLDQNDICLLYTTTNIQWSRGVGPICLPFLYQYTTFDNFLVLIAGWGQTSFAGPSSTVLQKATVRTITNAACQNYYSNVIASEMCTAAQANTNSDSCQYDSGGPVMFQGNRMLQFGIISFGSACGIDAPAVNTRVTSYIPWIIANADAQNMCKHRI